MCDKCKDKALDNSGCSVCGTKLSNTSTSTSFDSSKFEELSNDDISAEFDKEKFKSRSE